MGWVAGVRGDAEQLGWHSCCSRHGIAIARRNRRRESPGRCKQIWLNAPYDLHARLATRQILASPQLPEPPDSARDQANATVRKATASTTAMLAPAQFRQASLPSGRGAERPAPGTAPCRAALALPAAGVLQRFAVRRRSVLRQSPRAEVPKG